MIKNGAAIAIIILISAFAEIYPQKEMPFSTFKIEMNISTPFNKNYTSNFWEYQRGYKFVFETPFYFGKLQFGMIAMPYTGKEDLYPDFREKYVFAGIGDEIKFPLNFFLYSGIELGHFMMNFDSNELSEYEKNESEFSAGVNFRLSNEVINNLFLSVYSDITVLFTKKKLKYYYLSGGLAYMFDSPKWLKDFFN